MKTLRQRKPLRLIGYDYSQGGCYFITICTKNREYLFGNIMDGIMLLNDYGKIAEMELNNIPNRYHNVGIERYIIMPNHVHMIITINPTERINPFPTVDVPNIVGKYKAGVTRIVGNAFMRSEKTTIWQKSYHDHIIRNEESYLKIYEYIQNNPLQWELDCHNPSNPKYKEWSENNGTN